MKVQCACGTKYAFDVTPEMAQSPIQIVCQKCGTDISDFVNQLIRQELQATQPLTAAAAEAAEVAAPDPAGVPSLVPTPPAGAPRARIAASIHRPQAAAAAPAAQEMPICLKHPPHRTTNKCFVCQKPICPECMRLFGYVCSPLCKEKADLRGIKIPTYAGQRARVEARESRKTWLGVAAVVALLLALAGGYAWYIFAGCLPRPYFSVKYDERSYSGDTAVVGEDQLVYLHGEKLVRYDIKKKAQIWRRDLVDQKEFARKYDGETVEDIKDYLKSFLDDFQLKVSGKSIWVLTPGKMRRYDWDSGEPKEEVALVGGSEAIVQKDELLIIGDRPGNRTITHVSFADGQKRVEKVNEIFAAGKAPKTTTVASGKGESSGGRGLGDLLRPGGNNASGPLDAGRVADEVQSLSTPARIALPAVVASAYHQQKIFNELNDTGEPPRGTAAPPSASEAYSLVPTAEGCYQFGVRLLEERTITHTAMKEKPKTSALASAKATDTRAVANEIFNEIQRDLGGDTVTEDNSRYWVTLRRSDDQVKTEWVGEVVGPTGLMPLKTVNVLASGNMIRVFDKENKKLWEAQLNFNVALENFSESVDDERLNTGAGPCVEHDGALYVADEGVLTAFDLKSGEVRWRLPSVGVAGLFFDKDGMIYVNTTTANLDKIKYARQIDIGDSPAEVILKINPKNGKTLWSMKPGGFVNYVSGKYLYSVSAERGNLTEDGESTSLVGMMDQSPYLRIKRINPKNGKVVWSYRQDRYPLNVKFRDNTIQLIFRKEVQGLKFYTF